MGGTITAAFGLNQAFQLNGINLVYVDGMGYVYGFISEEINNLVGANDSADLHYNHERQMIRNQLNTDTPNLTNSMASNAHQFSTYNYNLVATATFQNSNNSGTSIQIPYYKVISENKDLTFSPRLFFDNELLVQTEYRNCLL